MTSVVSGLAVKQEKFFRWMSPIAALALLLFSLIFQQWKWARFPRMLPRFGDLQIITATATCIQGENWSITGPTCDPFGRPYNYPVIWAQAFAALGLNDSRAIAVGHIMGLLLIAALAMPLILLARSRCGTTRVAVLSLCVASPPIALGLERGNTDGLILVVLVVSGVMYFRKRQVSAALMGTVTGLKFFPVLVVAAFQPARRKYSSLAIFVLFMIAMLALSAESFVRLAEMQDPTAEFRFGSLLLPFYIVPVVFNFPRLWVLSGGAVLTLITALLVWGVIRTHVKSMTRALGSDSLGSSLFTLGGLVFVGSFVSGSRGDYSQMFLVITLLGLALSPANGWVVKLLFALGLLSLWGAFWIHPELVLGDIATASCVCIITAVLLQGRLDEVKQDLRARTG